MKRRHVILASGSLVLTAAGVLPQAAMADGNGPCETAAGMCEEVGGAAPTDGIVFGTYAQIEAAVTGPTTQMGSCNAATNGWSVFEGGRKFTCMHTPAGWRWVITG